MLVYSGLRPPRVPGQGTAALADRHSFRAVARVGATAFTSLLGLRGQLNAWLMATFGLSTPPINPHHLLGLILLARIFYCHCGR